jgi:DNA-binding LytR/AlgR family response regulator
MEIQSTSKTLQKVHPQRDDTKDTRRPSTGPIQSITTFPQQFQPWSSDFLNPSPARGKKSFLITKGNKYLNVPTETIALFYVRRESTMILCFDKQGYYVNYSLDHIQALLPEDQFYRLNRQYLINFNAVKDVEHYFSRRLLVNTVIPSEDKLIVSKEKVTDFLHWLDNR